MIRIEVCTASIDDSLVAVKAGASRLELNCSLETGGLSPSPGVLSIVAASVDVPVVSMVRPRSGGFIYSPCEKKAMIRDMELFFSLGAAGVVFGALDSLCRIDLEFTDEIRERFPSAELVFHRAFDHVADKLEGALQLADLGIDRILTSGGEETALEGIATIRMLHREVGHRIEILPGSGINPSNAVEIAAATGCQWLHGSFSRRTHSETGLIPGGGEHTSAEKIRETIQALEQTAI